MAYFIDLFSPTTLEAFNSSDRNTSGFIKRQEKTARTVRKGDYFVCYVTKVSRWVGVLEVVSDSYVIDNTPIFSEEDDKYIVRFSVKPIVWLDIKKAIPIHEENIWTNLSFTKEHEKNSSTWTGIIRNSLNQIQDRDGELLIEALEKQKEEQKEYPFDIAVYKKLIKPSIKRDNKIISVTIPQEENDIENLEEVNASGRESIKIQAVLADIGEKMGYRIWIPKRDRKNVLVHWDPEDENTLINNLPMDYGQATMSTIEEIDVIWLKKRYIKRAFEVEHTTSIYSGILRMADLIALQPNLDIKLHIVAPYERKDKVLHEIQRPIFSLIEDKPLQEICTFISYDKVEELANEKRLKSMTDSVIDEIVEEID